MTIYFGEVFKKLRKDKDLTQEQIADILSVSPQAVSRWETGATYPDIATLPHIASFFETTIDELLGTGKAKAQAAIDGYHKQFQESMNRGSIYDAIEFMRCAVKEFPNDYSLLNKLMYALFVACSDDSGTIPQWQENVAKYDEEIIQIGERILRYCTDDDIRLDAKARLGFHYCETGRKAKGRKSSKPYLPATAVWNPCCIGHWKVTNAFLICAKR